MFISKYQFRVQCYRMHDQCFLIFPWPGFVIHRPQLKANAQIIVWFNQSACNRFSRPITDLLAHSKGPTASALSFATLKLWHATRTVRSLIRCSVPREQPSPLCSSLDLFCFTVSASTCLSASSAWSTTRRSQFRIRRATTLHQHKPRQHADTFLGTLPKW